MLTGSTFVDMCLLVPLVFLALLQFIHYRYKTADLKDLPLGDKINDPEKWPGIRSEILERKKNLDKTLGVSKRVCLVLALLFFLAALTSNPDTMFPFYVYVLGLLLSVCFFIASASLKATYAVWVSRLPGGD